MALVPETKDGATVSEPPRGAVSTWARIERVLPLALLAFTAIYVLCFCLAIPSRIDEAYTFNLATDGSLSHMLSALRDGADGCLPLYGILVFAWEKIFGSSELSLRLTSGLFVILLAGHTGKRLRRLFTPASAALAILLVLANIKFISYSTQARFYGLLLLAFSLLFWSTWDLIEKRQVSRKAWLWHALFCGLLWLSHPFGMVYSSILALLYLIFAVLKKTFSVINFTAFAGGPVFFLCWLPAFLVQRKINPGYPPGGFPGWRTYWEYMFLDSVIFCGVSVAGIILFLIARPRSKADSRTDSNREERRQPATSQLLAYSLGFILLLNVLLALLDATNAIPIYRMFAVRYVLVNVVAFAILFSAMLDKLAQVLQLFFTAPQALTLLRAQQALTAILLLVSIDVFWSEMVRRKSSRESYFRRVSELAEGKQLPIYCQDHMDAFFLATRTFTGEVNYVLEDNSPYRTFLFQLHKYYPRPTPICLADFFNCTNDVVLALYGDEAVIVNPQTRATPKLSTVGAHDASGP